MAILPASTIGILGGGQLGRMFVSAARRMGYEVIVLDPDPQSPAGGMASRHLQADYRDHAALDELARDCAVVTTEFENIPTDTLAWLEGKVPVRPSQHALAIAQDRIAEKRFIQSLDLATPAFVVLESEQDLARTDAIEYPAILKTARMGYDGKGQIDCATADDVVSAMTELGLPCVLEQRVNISIELSCVLGRSVAGECSFYPLAQNDHQHGILDVSRVPAIVDAALQNKACAAARQIADGLDYCGVMAVEFFVSREGQLLVNEIAPRPHNSGHFTLDACPVSQFELQLRMICGLAPGDLNLRNPVAMLNILGDSWPARGQPDWAGLIAIEGASLHLYGKIEPRAGRKMGHVNFVAGSLEQALANLQCGRNILNPDAG